MPTTRMAIISSVVATGRRTKMRDGFMCWPARSQPSSLTGARRSAAARIAAEATGAAAAGTEFALAWATRSVLVLGLRLGPGLRDFRGGRVRQLHRRAIAQAVAAIGHDDVVDVDAGSNRLGLAVHDAQHHRPHGD